MFTNDDYNHELDGLWERKSTHTVNQVITHEGQTYRYQVGEGWGRSDNYMRLDTMFGEFEVVPKKPMNKKPLTRKPVTPPTGAYAKSLH